ncbi:hypothetical protein CW731_06060 [Polaribacter sp. ALD11]|uniref:GT-D fold domain-containing glycosyltransferase n=1 Tax=Polaribacter sp. ALD11 TaxID=2058137 RepID=UPI000C314E02|nr:GT-D fold domain-containing glycosyltransferase [Polaribacter sp. ALD11]AUC84881.1 hypothetical protein CW731_06060 [Polaribacter sp. ALD11]
MKPLKYYFHNFFLNTKPDSSIISTKNIQDSFNYLDKRLLQKERLFFVRFGDGEFITMLKKNHRNYIYNEGLDKEVQNSFTIKDSNYLISCPINYPYDEYHAKGIYKQFSWQQEMIDVIEQKNFKTDFIFENPCIFQCMAVFNPKKLNLFLNKHVRNKRKMFVGSTDQKVTESLYGKIDYFVKIPAKNAYETIEEWWPEIERNIDKVDLIIPSAGSSSNAIALRLWDMNCDVKLIDLGSIVDAAARKVSRTWIRLQGHKILPILNPIPKMTFKEKFKYFKKDVKFFFRNQVI